MTNTSPSFKSEAQITVSPLQIETSKDHVFTIDFDGDNYISVFPEPLSSLSCAHEREDEAWEYLLCNRTQQKHGQAWAVEDSAGFLDVTVDKVKIVGTSEVDDEGYINPSMIEVCVGFTYLGDDYTFYFSQPTSGRDNRFYTRELETSLESRNFNRLVIIMGRDMAEETISSVLNVSEAQEIREKHIADNYEISDDGVGPRK